MKLRLLPKMLLFILLPALLGLCLLSWFSYKSAEKALNTQIVTSLDGISVSQAGHLEDLTRLLRNALHNSAKIDRIRNFLTASSEEEKAALHPRLQQALKALTEDYPLLSSVGLLNTEGRVVGHSIPSSINGDRKERAYFRMSMQGRDGILNSRSKSTDEVTTIISSPVIIEGKVAGVLFATLDLKTLNADVTSAVKMGRTGISFVYDGRGLLLMHPDKKYIGNEDGNLEWVKQALARRNGHLTHVWNGTEKETGFRYLPDVDWLVMVSVDRDELLAPAGDLLRGNLMLLGVIVLIVGATIFLLARSIVATMRDGVAFAERVAGGRFDMPPDLLRSLERCSACADEIGGLARNMGIMLENLKKLFAESEQRTREATLAKEEAHKAMEEAHKARIAAENAKREGMLAAAGQLEGMVAIISSVSTQLSARISQADQGAGEAARRLSEAATAMNEMNTTVQEVAHNASSASAVSADTRKKAASGAHVVERSLQRIESVHQASLALREDMRELNEHARSIDRIMGVISDIADQTNLLALNAAIEAARAGEAGRGFAVVADEVRKLAEKTMSSTINVGNAVKAIQQSSATSAEQVESTVRHIEEAATQAEGSGEALDAIVALAERTADQVRTIAAAGEQQSASSEEISKSVSHVDDIASRTAQAMRDAARAVNDLARQSAQFTELIREMKQA